MYLVTWNKTQYDLHSKKAFDGSVFTAPVTGLYSFYVNARHQTRGGQSNIYLRQNDRSEEKIAAQNTQQGISDYFGTSVLHATLLLPKNETVYVGLSGFFFDLIEDTTE